MCAKQANWHNKFTKQKKPTYKDKSRFQLNNINWLIKRGKKY